MGEADGGDGDEAEEREWRDGEKINKLRNANKIQYNTMTRRKYNDEKQEEKHETIVLDNEKGFRYNK